MPISPEPGCTGRSSSVNTFVVGIWLNFAVDGGRPFMVMLIPIEPSVEPMASTSTSCSIRSSSASLTSAVHMTPEEMIVRNEDVSYGRPAAAASSSARRMGFEKASPTMAMAFAR